MKVTKAQLQQIIKEELEAVLSEQKLGVGDRFRDKLFRTVFPRAGEARQSNAAYYKRRAEEEAAEEKALAAQDAEEEAANKRSKDAAAYKKRADIGQAAAEEISKSRKNLSRAGFGREENPDKLNTLIHRQVNIGDREPPSGRADYTALFLREAEAHLALLRQMDPEFYDAGYNVFRSLEEEIQHTQDFIKALKDYGKGAERAAARPSFQQFDSAGTRASFDPKTQIRRGNQILRKSNFTRTSRFD
tara:strand:+ start:2803 stop:3540 length:738 start_codon:yes stop_codon:yes gene_type:complete